MSYDKSVFINCPFDTSFKDDILKPMIFVLLVNDLIPRLASEVSDSGQLRLEKITNIMKECKYGIHDLSIVKSKNIGEYARMNMPFELGIDYGLRQSGAYLEKQFLILEATKYDYQKALSDINGFDIKVHHNDTQKLIECIYKWCSETLKINKQNPPLILFNDYVEFNTSLFEKKSKEYSSDKVAKNYIDHLTIPEYINELYGWLKK